MTIAKGQPWGEAGGLPPGAPMALSDADVARHAAAGGHAVVGLAAGGDLARTVGVRPGVASTGMLLPVDLGEVTVDGVTQLFAAHVVIRRSWWRGPVVAIMNAQYLGRFDVAPRSHPNDGVFDVVDLDQSMGIADRWKARRRLPSGTHVPHPQITVRRLKEWSCDLSAPSGVWVDGAKVTSAARSISFVVLPDRLTLAV